MYHKNMYQIQNYQKQQPEVDMTEQLLLQKKIQLLIKKQQKKIKLKRKKNRKKKAQQVQVLKEMMLQNLQKYLGYKYVAGGSSPSTGFDCSGFTTYVFRNFGVSLNRSSKDQIKMVQQ